MLLGLSHCPVYSKSLSHYDRYLSEASNLKQSRPIAISGLTIYPAFRESHRELPPFSVVPLEPSRNRIHWASWLSRTRHWPPTLNAGRSFFRIIRCRVRVETWSICAASGSVSSRRLSNSFSINYSQALLEQCRCHRPDILKSLFLREKNQIYS